MNMFQVLLIDIIVLLFPFLMHLFYKLYTQNIDKRKEDGMLDFVLISSLYLQVVFCEFSGYYEFLILLNVPLIIAFLEKKPFSSLCISIIIILCHYMIKQFSFPIICIQYSLLYLLYLCFYQKKKGPRYFINIAIIVQSVCLLLEFLVYQKYTFSNFLNILLILVVFIITTGLILFVLKKGEDIASFHMSIKELEKEKQYRTSLFKITHEIKNPIAVCKSYLDMFDFDNKEHKKYIPIVKEEIQKVLYLLQDFSCMNKIKVEKELLDVTLLINDIIEQFKPVLMANDIHLHYSILDDEIYIEGDYNRLNQVLINIIKNAIEAKIPDKEMELTISSYKEKETFFIQVKDTGMGFDMDEFEKIKEPFYTTKKNGTGLGVSLSYEILEAHCGKMEYDSALGKGTTVVISLPIVPLD